MTELPAVIVPSHSRADEEEGGPPLAETEPEPQAPAARIPEPEPPAHALGPNATAVVPVEPTEEVELSAVDAEPVEPEPDEQSSAAKTPSPTPDRAELHLASEPLRDGESVDEPGAASLEEQGTDVPAAPPERPVRVVHIGEIEARELIEPEPPTLADEEAASGLQRRSDHGPRRRRKLFRKGGHQ